MIYFGWNGWGPWHTPEGSIWCLVGFVLGITMITIKRREVWGVARCAAPLFLCGLLIGGYFAWFAVVEAMAHHCWGK